MSWLSLWQKPAPLVIACLCLGQTTRLNGNLIDWLCWNVDFTFLLCDASCSNHTDTCTCSCISYRLWRQRVHFLLPKMHQGFHQVGARALERPGPTSCALHVNGTSSMKVALPLGNTSWRRYTEKKEMRIVVQLCGYKARAVSGWGARFAGPQDSTADSDVLKSQHHRTCS